MRFPDTFLIYDLETTGFDLPSNPCDVIEIGARLIKNGRVYTEKSWLIKIGTPLTDEIVKLTGITNDMLATQGIDEGKAFREFASLAVHAEALVGHNILKFDNAIVNRKAAIHGVESYFEKAMSRCIDTAALYKGKEMGEKVAWSESLCDWQRRIMEARIAGLKFNLALAHEALGFPSDGIVAHRAAGDIEMTHRVYSKLIETV